MEGADSFCKYILSLLFIIIPCYCDFNAINQYGCYQQFGSSALVIEPRATIYGRVNQTLNVKCISNPIYNISSGGMYFTRGLSSKLVNESHQVLNENTISLNISKENPSKFQLTCQDSENNKCIRQIIIGYSPLNVKNFQCVSFSWDTLECSYDLVENPTQRKKDNYFLSYSSGGKSVPGYKCESSQFDKCCRLEGKECWRWNGSGEFLYEYAEQYLEFTISSANSLGNSSYTYIINQFETMIPDPASDVELRYENNSQVRLSWRLPKFLKQFPPGIVYRITIEVCHREEQIISRMHDTKKFTEMFDAKYPGQLYNYSVFLRSGNRTWEENNPSDRWWSQPVTQTIVTPSLPPKHSPTTTPGSFHVNNWELNATTLTLYWKDVDDCFKGGKGFKYLVHVLTSNGSTDVKNPKITENYAVYENFILEDKIYIFHIIPVNEAGRGEKEAIIKIGEETLRPKDVFFPIIIYHTDDKILQLKWFSQEDNQANFTLFWCTIDQQFEGQCKSISWKLVYNETETNITTKELGIIEELELQNLRVGVSTQKWRDGEVHSSGIVWADCLIEKHDLETSREAPSVNVVNKTSSTVEIIWQLDCKTWKGFPLSIEIIWCEGKHNTTAHCAVTTRTADISENSYELNRLKPKQFYTLWIRINFKNFKSEFSSPTHFITDNRMPSYWIIVLFIALTIFISFGIIVLMVHSRKKLKIWWWEWNQKPRVPSGLRADHNGDNIKDISISSSTGNNRFLSSGRLDQRKSNHVEDYVEQPLLMFQNDLKNILESLTDLSKTTENLIPVEQDIDEIESGTNLEIFDVTNIYDELTWNGSAENEFSIPNRESKLVVKETLNSFPNNNYDLNINGINSLPNAGYVAATELYKFSKSCEFGPNVKNEDKVKNIKSLTQFEATIHNVAKSKSYIDLPTFVSNNTPSGYIQALSPILFDQCSSHELGYISKANISQDQDYLRKESRNLKQLVKSKSYSPLPNVDCNTFSPLGYVQAISPSSCQSLSNRSDLSTSIYNNKHMCSLSYVSKDIEINKISQSNPYVIWPILPGRTSSPQKYIYTNLPTSFSQAEFLKDEFKLTNIHQNEKIQDNNPTNDNYSKLTNDHLQDNERTNHTLKSTKESSITQGQTFQERKGRQCSITSQEENCSLRSIFSLVEEGNKTFGTKQKENQKIEEYITLSTLDTIISNSSGVTSNTLI